MSIANNHELDVRIHSFLERKTKRFPELAKIEANQERSGLLVKIHHNVSDLLHPLPRRAH